MIYGTRDEVIPREVFDRYADIVKRKGGDIRMIESTGHKILIDEGVKEKAHAEIIHFISGVAISAK